MTSPSEPKFFGLSTPSTIASVGSADFPPPQPTLIYLAWLNRRRYELSISNDESSKVHAERVEIEMEMNRIAREGR